MKKEIKITYQCSEDLSEVEIERRLETVYEILFRATVEKVQMESNTSV